MAKLPDHAQNGRRRSAGLGRRKANISRDSTHQCSFILPPGYSGGGLGRGFGTLTRSTGDGTIAAGVFLTFAARGSFNPQVNHSLLTAYIHPGPKLASQLMRFVEKAARSQSPQQRREQSVHLQAALLDEKVPVTLDLKPTWLIAQQPDYRPLGRPIESLQSGKRPSHPSQIPFRQRPVHPRQEREAIMRLKEAIVIRRAGTGRRRAEGRGAFH